MCSFQCLYHQPVFQKKDLLYLTWLLPSLLWYLTEYLNLLSMFNRNVGLTSNCAMVIVSENVVEEPLSQTRVDMTNTKTKHLLSVSTKTGEGWYA